MSNLSREELTRQWEAHFRARTPAWRSARHSVSAEFGAEGDDKIKRPSRAVAIATMAKALRTEGARLGHPISDNLLRMMLGQKLGAEGAMPGLMGTTFAGTNNSGAAQVPGGKNGEAFALARKAMRGWGAFAHRDSNPPGPHGGPYIGWYYIAPTVEDSAHQWLTGYAGTKRVLTENPQTPEDYARIMRDAGYYTGFTNDREKEIGNYAKAIRRGMPSLDQINGPSNDPTVPSVDPSQFRSLSERKITKDLYDLAKRGGPGGMWQFLLPDTWEELEKNNGVVWFGPAISSALGFQANLADTIVNKAVDHPLETVGIVGTLLLGIVAILPKRKTP
jgi:hypothetical protein